MKCTLKHCPEDSVVVPKWWLEQLAFLSDKARKDLKHCPKDSIVIPRSWLKQLAELSDKARIDQEKWFEGLEKLPPTSFNKLIGYSSSAEFILTPKK